MRTILIISILIFSFATLFSQNENQYYNQNLIDSMMKDTLLLDPEAWYYKSSKQQIIKTVDCLHNDKGIKELMFPFSQYDSIIAYKTFEKYRNGEVEYDDLYISIRDTTDSLKFINISYPGVKLDNDQLKQLLDFVYNPIHFTYGECSSGITQIAFVFYYNNTPVAYITARCNYDSLSFYPINCRAKYGGIVKQKDIDYIIKLIKEIGLYY